MPICGITDSDSKGEETLRIIKIEVLHIKVMIHEAWVESHVLVGRHMKEISSTSKKNQSNEGDQFIAHIERRASLSLSQGIMLFPQLF